MRASNAALDELALARRFIFLMPTGHFASDW